MIAQHELLRIRIQVHLLVHPLRHRVAIQVVLEQRHGHNQWHQPLAVVLDQPQQLLLVVARQVLLQLAHQVLEDVDVLPLRPQECQSLHE
jgi:hypothetical protein